MNKRDFRWVFSLPALVLALGGCSYNVKIEPSDKPFIVNLNVKVDHEVKLQIQEKNKDLLQLEEQAVKKKPKS